MKPVGFILILILFVSCERFNGQVIPEDGSENIGKDNFLPESAQVKPLITQPNRQDINKSYHEIKRPWVLAKPLRDTDESNFSDLTNE